MLTIVTLARDELEALLIRASKFGAEQAIEETSARTPELMTKGELAEYLRCDVSKINRKMKEGLPYIVFGNHPRYRKSDIDYWLEQSV